jgi:NAD(P)-dependent dehydrogenase (short-subunit alcohol dehydrogenase family)
VGIILLCSLLTNVRIALAVIPIPTTIKGASKESSSFKHSKTDDTVHFFLYLRSLTSDVCFNVINTGHLSTRFFNKFSNGIRTETDKKRFGVVTGAVGGIGKSLCHLLTSCGFDLSITARIEKAGELHELIQQSKGNVQAVTADLAMGNGAVDPKLLILTLQDAAKVIIKQSKGKLDILVHNAGLMAGSERDIHSVNFFSPVVLTLLLLPQLMSSPCYDPVIVFVSSCAHMRASHPFDNDVSLVQKKTNVGSKTEIMETYGDSKLRLVLSAAAIERRFENTGLIVRSVHPGIVETPMLQGFLGIFGTSKFPGRGKFLRSANEGASALLIAAFDRKKCSIEIGDSRKSYFRDGKSSPSDCSNYINDKVACDRCFTGLLGELTPEIRKVISSQARTAARKISKDTVLLSPLIGDDSSEILTISASIMLRKKRSDALLALAMEVENILYR